MPDYQQKLKAEINMLCDKALRDLAELRRAIVKQAPQALASPVDDIMLKGGKRTVSSLHPPGSELRKRHPSESAYSHRQRSLRLLDRTQVPRGATLFDARRHAREIAAQSPKPGPGTISGLNIEEIKRLYAETVAEIRRLQAQGASADSVVTMADIRLKSLVDKAFQIAEELHARGFAIPD